MRQSGNGSPLYPPGTVIINQSSSAAPTVGGMAPLQTDVGRPRNIMNPVDSLVTCFQKYVGFEGRASRSEYWWFFLFTFIASFIAGIIDAILFGIELTDPTPVTWILQMAVLLPTIAVSIRRIHDHGKSGWFCIVPFYNIFLFATEGQHVPNSYGPIPTNLMYKKTGNQYVIIQQ